MNTMKKYFLWIGVGLLLSQAIFAAPAAWYEWKSKVNSAKWCAQTYPGEGWVKLSGPYKDAHCKILGQPGK